MCYVYNYLCVHVHMCVYKQYQVVPLCSGQRGTHFLSEMKHKVLEKTLWSGRRHTSALPNVHVVDLCDCGRWIVGSTHQDTVRYCLGEVTGK